jgi:hypothetical protein
MTEIDARDVVKPRTIGILWLICIVTSILGFVFGIRPLRLNDPATTAAFIQQHDLVFRFASFMDIVAGMAYVGVTALLFYLLRPVNRSGSLLAALFGTCGIAIGGISWILRLASLGLLQGGVSLQAFSPLELQSAAAFALRLQAQVFIVGMLFFGAQCAIAGSLIARSTFIPKLLGILLAAGGGCYVIASTASLMAPVVGQRLTMAILPIAMIGEGSLTVWLLLKGVDPDRWKSRATAAAA